jgi:hypothetical protein
MVPNYYCYCLGYLLGFAIIINTGINLNGISLVLWKF